ncbi:glutathione peroxidase [Roseivivax lentus]|uniref:Glutathione peroxidase n=1 Tax=Roseivivax lentus TaxID=633194 RepID=A0A1N7NN72_9RHOB|nr:glutathione peroxidase [Roseivivax lentus]SIS99772.1 glutathione peroxidase [Roseivivax lentus]
MIRTFTALAAFLFWALPAAALDFSFPSIDGGTLEMADWEGRPVLVVNTASRCAFTDQYDALQALYDRYREQGLVVLAVPSDDFRQELSSDAEVKEFCEVNFGLDLPMTTITSVRGAAAHPFYAWLRDTADFAPTWNFNKVLIGPEGQLVATYGATTRPLAAVLTREIDALLSPPRG